MLIVPAIVTLFTYLYWRPQQILDLFRFVTINFALSVSIFAYVLDWRAGAVKPRGSPLLALLGGFTVWSVITMVVKAPDRMSEQLVKLAVPLLVVVLVSEGIQSLRAFRAVGRTLLLFTVALAALGVEQGLAPTGCFLTYEVEVADAVSEGFDGRPCTSREQCYEGGAPNADYLCEHQGLLGTASFTGRVRYRGILEDPNELAWALSMGIPFIFAFYEGRPSRKRLLILVAAIGVTLTCVIMTESRSGQLSLLANLGVYFIRRYRVRGVIAGAVAAIPLLILGGRSDANAQSSTDERLNCWSEAIGMWRENPVIGVGSGQFLEHHFQTAHNSFLLALAEAGPLGLLLWTSAIYFAIKVTVRVQTDLRDLPEAATARSWAMALMASMVGLVTSAVFLSLTYHPILWIFLGMIGALYASVRKHQPDFRVAFRLRDLVLVSGLDVAFIAFIAVYLRLKGI
jgi:O-antigen ligase